MQAGPRPAGWGNPSDLAAKLPTLVINHAKLIDAAADEKYEPLVKAAQLKRSVIMYDVPNFSGEWVAIPRSDFDLLREALRQIEREKK